MKNEEEEEKAAEVDFERMGGLMKCWDNWWECDKSSGMAVAWLLELMVSAREAVLCKSAKQVFSYYGDGAITGRHCTIGHFYSFFFEWVVYTYKFLSDCTWTNFSELTQSMLISRLIEVQQSAAGQNSGDA